MSTLENAIAIAATAHAGVLDKGGAPYIFHPLRVMFAVLDDAARLSGVDAANIARNALIAAVLHDVIEDTDWTIERLRQQGFADEVLEALDALTRRAGETYEAFCKRAARHPIARVVKRADIQDNMNLARIPNPTPADEERRERYGRCLKLLDAQPSTPR